MRLQLRIPDFQSRRSRCVNIPRWLAHLIARHQQWLSAARDGPDRMEKCCCLWKSCWGGHRRPREPGAWPASLPGDALRGIGATGASLAAGTEHVDSCHANTCLLRHLPRNIVGASQHPVISCLCDLHLAKSCPVAEGWCVCTHYRVSQGAFLWAVGFTSRARTTIIKDFLIVCYRTLLSFLVQNWHPKGASATQGSSSCSGGIIPCSDSESAAWTNTILSLVTSLKIWIKNIGC